MAGLLDIDMGTPEGQGFNSALMQAAAALLTPRHRGGGMGAAFAAFPQAIEQSKALAQRNRMLGLQEQQMGLQTAEAQRKAQAQAAQHQNLMRLIAGLPPEQQAAAMVAPEKFAEAQLPQKPTFQSWYEGGQKRSGFVAPGMTPQPVGEAAPPDMDKWLIPDGQGGWKPNDALINARSSVARAGAPSVEVKVDNKMGESLGAQIGPMLKASRDKTEGAMKLGATGQQIIEAIDSGKVIAGPGASWVMRGAQIAEMLGVGGKDNSERILNTRRVIRGLAESAVEARKELAGQGQVTENEAKAVEKAMAGNIDELTVDEIKLIAGLNVKAARLRASQHQQMVSNIPESMRSAAPFYAIPGMDQWLQTPEPSAPAPTPGKVRMRFDPKVGAVVPVK